MIVHKNDVKKQISSTTDTWIGQIPTITSPPGAGLYTFILIIVLYPKRINHRDLKSFAWITLKTNGNISILM